MKLFKIMSALFAMVVAFAGTPPGTIRPDRIIKWAIVENSTLSVKGRSNVNSFTCNINVSAHNDTIICTPVGSGPSKLTGAIEMDVIRFDCHSSMITRDLRKTLKAAAHPKMTIRFLTLNSIPGLLGKTECINGLVQVELAGNVKRFEVEYTFVKNGSLIELNGERMFNFSDFKLTPPKKMAGMIKIKDAFRVNFQLVLKPV